jgi:hypothetical protein
LIFVEVTRCVQVMIIRAGLNLKTNQLSSVSYVGDAHEMVELRLDKS